MILKFGILERDGGEVDRNGEKGAECGRAEFGLETQINGGTLLILFIVIYGAALEGF
jgi:hypothetical protein